MAAPSSIFTPPDLLQLTAEAVAALDSVVVAARQRLRAALSPEGVLDAARLDERQFSAHGFAWLATYATALREMRRWALRLDAMDRLGATEMTILQIAFGEYLAQVEGGIPLAQGEFARPGDIGLEAADLAPLGGDAVARLKREGNTAEARLWLGQMLADSAESSEFGAFGIDDPTLDLIRAQFRRFGAERVAPHCHRWHLADSLIPIEIIEEMAALGVFGLTVPEQWGGHGLGKLAMCIVSEELSRAYIGVGSLGTRSEIAAELIRMAGTDAQKQRFLARIASGEILPTAAFTEPDTGSDLARLATRAVREGNRYRIYGAKTWMTHGARSDLMTLLARTDTRERGYAGLSMFLAEKPRGSDAEPFPAPGMRGTEIPVLGYRGMKEYEVAFDGFAVDAGNLLGEQEGQGFKQLMATFESARVQTASRAVGVAQNALELGLRYALERRQFGRAIHAFPRVHGKLAWMAVETMVARQLTYFAAREKDQGRRCDIEAGMAKLLAARTAWANADNAVQIHGGNGFALEYPISRVLCDARILNIFEGAAEIQAQVIARGLLSGRN